APSKFAFRTPALRRKNSQTVCGGGGSRPGEKSFTPKNSTPGFEPSGQWGRAISAGARGGVVRTRTFEAKHGYCNVLSAAPEPDGTFDEPFSSACRDRQAPTSAARRTHPASAAFCRECDRLLRKCGRCWFPSAPRLR